MTTVVAALPPSSRGWRDYSAPRRPLLPHSRRRREITEQLADLFAHFFAVHDHVDQAVFLEKFCGLESFWQILMRGFFDHARTGKTNHALRLGNNHIA